MKDLEKLLQQYKKIDFVLSIEDEKEQMYEYVYATNKLEGNQLTLAQTTQLLSSDTISGSHIKTSDLLEQKGMYKALSRMLRAVREKEELSIDLMLELNWHSLGHLWKYEDSYIDAKSKGQLENSFKISQNLIRITQGGKVLERLEPLSDPKTAKENMIVLLDKIKQSKKDDIFKVAYLAQEIWLHQPFVDGNKRTGRLLINFLLMKEGYPLFPFEDKSQNYNSLLVEQYRENKLNLVINYITENLKEKMRFYISLKNKTKRKDRGFRMML